MGMGMGLGTGTGVSFGAGVAPWALVEEAAAAKEG
jgi:hypothetical protein